jgi:hypothetical protein
VRRLLKVWLPASLVAEMDEQIRVSRAYNGRDDFLLEAVRDRIADDREGAPRVSKPMVLPGSPLSAGPVLALWADATVLTAPLFKLDGSLSGLHNRDYPTLWAADLLASMVAARGEPVGWIHFIGRACSAAWDVSEQLGVLDEDRGELIKASIGFPRNRMNRVASEERFADHMVGTLRDGKASGPIFALGLAGTADGPAPDRIAPTKPGIKLLAALREAGLSARPPHPSSAWPLFRDHLKKVLNADLDEWMTVVRGVAEGPTPEVLVQNFRDRWTGSSVQTNVNGYISRAREWGLVEPKLVDGHYSLTRLGRTEAEEVGR